MGSDLSVTFEKKGAVGIISLNRPEKYNGVNTELLHQLKHHLEHCHQDSSIRSVILRGEGQGFCGGADLENFAAGIEPEYVRDYLIEHYQPLLRLMVTLPKPIIGAVHGSAAGVGAALALACDLRIMAEDANIRYAFINIALGPDGGASWLLARLVGYARAFEIAVEGKKIDAKTCLQLGLTNRIAVAGNLMSDALHWATELAERPTLAVALTKDALHQSLNQDIYQNIALEAENQVRAFKSSDFQEGVHAFLQKRQPRFTGS
ncbi:MAG: enoyl-CoA hydratase/isomerase family protein [Saprospiraceae bacterium]|nr:enoyl-CoA hydratase/isomerase family protein [Saprospiraceae bacterium]MDP4821768.1 enoyl-CoA hydratase/isomerase family protein [Saprospiraceae bacterium]MDP4997924.1 enoyl-CoA hydratase/isomerase family protein [Saprospiraceae bacterium]